MQGPWDTAQFAEDFGVCPGLLRRMDVMHAFRHADRADYSADAPHNRADQLNFPEFVQFLVQCAVLAYDRPAGGSMGWRRGEVAWRGGGFWCTSCFSLSPSPSLFSSAPLT